ncbi:hypothetical protein HPP92_021205 [Vanilla planifolia]|uniref:Uncharacterized protein n=1 Tax=Vanilla planifolia TaxID=51239 RepID=A0A835Q1H9_VANPL|nr:hypothetical protein HPP92_021205 [Vanilla planifolia]
MTNPYASPSRVKAQFQRSHTSHNVSKRAYSTITGRLPGIRAATLSACLVFTFALAFRSAHLLNNPQPQPPVFQFFLPCSAINAFESFV